MPIDVNKLTRVEDIIVGGKMYNYIDLVGFINKQSKAIENRIAQDKISISLKTALKFMELFEGAKESTEGPLGIQFSTTCPGDLIFGDTVPLKEIELVFSDVGIDSELPYSSHISIMDKKDWVVLSKSQNSTSILVGYIIDSDPFSPKMLKETNTSFNAINGVTLNLPILLTIYNDGITRLNIEFDCIVRKNGKFMLSMNEPSGFEGRNMISNKCRMQVNSVAISYMIHLLTWYGIQIGLLHPELKTIFSKNISKSPANRTNSINNTKKKRRVKYQKLIRVDQKDYDEIISKRTINRKCLLWYVIGHYRERNGRKYWVDGFWKGALRATKSITDIEDQRNREVATSLL